jgi:hypothetical protein
MYPEGGDLIAGLPCGVYVEAKNPNQKPADIVGSVVDSHGAEVAQFKTEHEGRGRFGFTPAAGEKYSIHISRPAGIHRGFELPEIKADGVSIVSDQLVVAASDPLKFTLHSTKAESYTVTLSKHGVDIASSSWKQGGDGDSSKLAIALPAWADGVLVATVKDKAGTPVAERLVFRKPSHSLHVAVKADKSSYVPAGTVNLTVTTTDDDGKPIASMVGITATDESVLQMIEKRERAPRLPAMALLENDVKDLADADVYLNPSDPKGPLAVDLLLGTQGWRRFATVDQTKFITAFGDAAHRALADLQPVAIDRMAVFDGPMGGGGGFGGGGGGNGGRGGARFRFAVAANAAVPEAAQQEAQLAAAAKPVALDDAANRRDARQVKAEADRPAFELAEKRVQGQAMAAGGGGGGGGFGGRRLAANRLLMMPATPVVRIYAHDVAPNRQNNDRTDFTETLYWCAGVKTDAKDGTAKVSFKLNDSVTSFKISADAFDDSGALGEGTATVASVQPFYIEPKMPLEVSCGDVIRLPIAAVNSTDNDLSPVQIGISPAKHGVELSTPIDPFKLGANTRERTVAELKVGSTPMRDQIKINAAAGKASDGTDEVTRELVIKPLGFPIEFAQGGTIDASKSVSHTIEIPQSVVAGSISTNVALYPTPLANMTEALQRLLQEPNGCFEQTSSTTYPLVMADQYFTTHTGVDPQLIARSNELLAKGYDRLRGFECKNKGYEWFGEDPGHECLSAFGLLEFTDMSQVREVDQAMLTNTRTWLLARRDGAGGYSHERRALHTWIADPGCANGYCTWALLECGQKDMSAEVKWIKDRAQTDDNSYVTALAANCLYLAGDSQSAKPLMDRLAKNQDKDGHVLGAKTTVVGSGGDALEIETTSLATLAWLRDSSYSANVESGIHFLADSCKAGRFGSTQSTVLALRAIVAYDKSRAHPTAAGSIQLLVDDKPIGDPIAFDSKTQGAIKLPDIADRLTPGKHDIGLKMSDGSALPYAVAVTYNSITPASADQCKLKIETALKDEQITEGSPTQANVTVTNTSDDVLPTPIAIVGLPGGLEVRHDQLKELVKADRIAAYEVRGREVILYWRDIQPQEKLEIPLSAIAAVPGTYTAPASRVYQYYTDEFKQWAQGMKVTIAAK